MAGSAATIACLDLDLVVGMTTLLGARSRSNLDWLGGAELARTNLEPKLPRRRQLSLRREASVFASHPPTGLRGALIATAEYHSPRVVLTDAETERIDAELATLAKRYHRTIAYSW